MLLSPAQLGPGNLIGVTRDQRKDRHTYRKAGVRWAVCSNGAAQTSQNLKVVVMYSTGKSLQSCRSSVGEWLRAGEMAQGETRMKTFYLNFNDVCLVVFCQLDTS